MPMRAIIAGVFWYRRRLGLVSSSETGIVVGCAALVCLFLASVPLSHAQVALVVQLQTSRIFWLLDVLGSAYMGWLLIESPLWSQFSAHRSSILRSARKTFPAIRRTPVWA